ncbi:hypothetical protein [Gimesia chilikensis]|uniref:Uncharacterized protein n=1 Tax=Gimesia chilikensis TaxID=2605989 RepID=A0A517PIR7_9PLAN|nr:hypothetical protein [Gimesia chilikensis]QDT19211.1 hypothetical protein HG66A1_09750 [Gimesia chilikensis]
MVSKTFKIELEGVNDWITTEGAEGKLKRIAGACGLRVLSLQPLDEQEDPDASMQARLIDWIRDQGGTSSVGDVVKAFGFRSAEDAFQMMRRLTDSGAGCWLSLPLEAAGVPLAVVELFDSGRSVLSGLQTASGAPQETGVI